MNSNLTEILEVQNLLCGYTRLIMRPVEMRGGTSSLNCNLGRSSYHCWNFNKGKVIYQYFISPTDCYNDKKLAGQGLFVTGLTTFLEFSTSRLILLALRCMP